MENMGTPNNKEKSKGMSRGSFLKNMGIFGAGMLLMGEKALGQESHDLASRLETKEVKSPLGEFIKDARSAYEQAAKRYEEQRDRLEAYAKEHPGEISPDMITAERARFEAKEANFKRILDGLKTELGMLENGAWPRGAASLEYIADEQVILDASKSDHVRTMGWLEYDLLTTLDVGRFGENGTETVALIPLTSGWFESTPWLKQHYEEVWNANSMLSNAGSGEVIIHDEDRARILFESLKTLQEHISSLPEGPEREWIASRNLDDLKDRDAFIFLHDKSFSYDFSTKMADSINVEQSFGPVKIHPLQTILLHELNMGQGILPDDTHIKPGHESKPDPYLSAVNAAYVLKRIKERETHFPDAAELASR